MKTACVITNMNRDADYRTSRILINLLEARDVRVICCPEVEEQACAVPKEELSQAEMAFVLGGDGTILRAAHMLAPMDVPILGLNLGNLGFLAESDPDNLEEIVERVVKDDYILDVRSMLEACILREDDSVRERVLVLNEIEAIRALNSGVISLDVFVGDMLVGRYTGDGVLIATPTGSTAYSLSAGGPIVCPKVHAILITPISPRTLSSRPIVVRDSYEVTLVAADDKRNMMLAPDGQQLLAVHPNERVVVKKAAIKAKFIRLSKVDFFAQLRRKLTEWNKPNDSR